MRPEWVMDLVNWEHCTCFEEDDPNCPEHREESA